MDNFDKYVGRIFDGRYKIIKVIGIGGMAVVFEAFDLAMKRSVAIKMLKDEITHDAASVKRFVNESKAVSMLSHPNIVSIYDVSVKENLKYIVMERVEGITLKSYMQQKKVLSLDEVLSFSEQILRALEHAHSKGIVHRDIKPQNIMLLKNGRIKVTDFGIAKLPDAETVTMTDKAIGTVYYISPEQASGKVIDQRSDLYSLGVMMYEMSTGKLPFTADSPVSVALMQVNREPARPREINPKIPIGLEQIILMAMNKDPKDRLQSAGTMLRYVLQIKSNSSFVFKIPEKKENKADADENDNHGDDEKSTSIFPITAGVFTAFITVLAVCAVVIFSRLSDLSGNSPYTVIIDNYVSKQYSEVVDSIDKSIYNVTYNLVYSDKYEPGMIIAQDPKAGEQRKVKENKQLCELKFDVSRGEEVYTIPDTSISEYRKIKQELVARGYDVRVEYENNDIVLSGYVIRTDPEAGTVLNEGQQVTLYVSSGQPVNTTTVPKFIGMTPHEAMRALIAADLALGRVTYEYSDEAPEGTVMAQSREEGSEVPSKLTEMDFTMSMGPDPATTNEIETGTDSEEETDDHQEHHVEPGENDITMPDLRGMSMFQAVDKLSNYANLEVGDTEYGYSDEYPAGKIMSQSIAPGTIIPKDKKCVIDIIISKGKK